MSDSRLTNATVVLSVSGGKDSAATSLYLQELGIEHLRVFADTGWEHPDTYAYLRGPLTEKLGPIDEVSGRDGGMVGLIRRKRMFPSRTRRFCTEELKVFPLQAYMDAVAERTSKPIVNAVGVRAAESNARSKMTEWEWSEAFDTWTWRPLINWSEQDVIDIHRRHNLAPNPLYLRGATRVGCWPCIFARKGELRTVAEASPDVIATIRNLEAELPPNPAADVSCPERGDWVHVVIDGEGDEVPVHPRECPQCGGTGKVRLPPMPRTFFHGRTSRKGIPLPIDRAVAWSRTAHGSLDQGALFHDLGQPEGCVRWGLCESAPDEEDAP